MWKRCGSDKPRQNAAARSVPSLDMRAERQAAVDRGRLLAPYKQEVARSSRVPPILAGSAVGDAAPDDCCFSRRAAVTSASRQRAAHRPKQQSFLVAGTWEDALEEALK